MSFGPSWMRRVVALAIAVAGAVLGYACGISPSKSQTPPMSAPSQQARVPGEYLVTLAAPSGAKAITDLYGRFGIKSLKELAPNVFLMTLAEDPGPGTMEKLRAGNVHIRAVEPNYIYRTQGGGLAR